MDLTQEHAEKLGRLHGQGFEIVAFPMYANYIGLRKGSCAALMEPSDSGRFKLFGQPTILIGDNFSVRVRQAGQDWFVWKQQRIEATPERMRELNEFFEEIRRNLF
ncbi:MAG TPA: hypothetical protein VMJ93_15910 [Verrucomicrobiae bacterium]|nr:hypothetical protein [Verrucomicrobiae bacterium]